MLVFYAAIILKKILLCSTSLLHSVVKFCISLNYKQLQKGWDTFKKEFITYKGEGVSQIKCYWLPPPPPPPPFPFQSWWLGLNAILDLVQLW